MAPDATSSLVEMIKEEKKHKEDTGDLFKPGAASPPEQNFWIGLMRTEDQNKQHYEEWTADNSPLVSEHISQMASPLGTNLMKWKWKMEKDG